jgi:hypothetical protein
VVLTDIRACLVDHRVGRGDRQVSLALPDVGLLAPGNLVEVASGRRDAWAAVTSALPDAEAAYRAAAEMVLMVAA